MPSDGNTLGLFRGACAQSMRRVKTALKAGANVNGFPEHLFPPIVAATLGDHAAMVNFLLEQGADPDTPVPKEVPCPKSDTAIVLAGERALHIAARTGKAAIVSLLLGAGANPALADEGGSVPLHWVAECGHTHFVDMLYSREPTTLNRCDAKGRTPLFFACGGGHRSMVSNLLSLGARQPMPRPELDMCPLIAAAGKGFVDVVRVLMNVRGGIRAVQGWLPMRGALYAAVRFRQARILRLLLMVDGEKKRLEWANLSNIEHMSLLHEGAGYCCPAEVSVLLEAGADEAARNLEGRIPLDIVGLGVGLEDEVRMDWGKGVAIRRMLQRCPAYRARSWAWPSGEEADDAGGSGDGGTAAAAADAVVVLSSPPTVKTSSVIGVRIFRPKENGSKFFVRLVGRYCAKD